MSGNTLMHSSGPWTSYMYEDQSGSGAVEITNDTSVDCQQLLEQGFPLSLSATTANTIRYIQIIYYSLCYPTGFLLNLFVMFIIARFKKLRNITFYLALQIITINVANILIFFPSSMANATADRFVFPGLCPAMGFLTSFLFSARNLLMFVLVVDRFCLIFLPFWYSRHRVKVVVPLSIAGWLIPLIITLTAAIAIPDCFNFQRFTWVCLWGGGCKYVAVCTSYSAFLTTMINVGTFTALLLYLILLCRARKLRNKVTVSRSNESEEDREIEKRNKKREQRANTTFLILFIALFGVTFPAYLIVTLGSVALNALSIQPQPASFTIIATLMTSLYILIFVMDPIVIMRNQDVREVVQTIVNKLQRKGRQAATSVSSETNPTTNIELQVQRSQNYPQ